MSLMDEQISNSYSEHFIVEKIFPHPENNVKECKGLQELWYYFPFN